MHSFNDSHHDPNSCVNAGFEKQYKIEVFLQTELQSKLVSNMTF